MEYAESFLKDILPEEEKAHTIDREGAPVEVLEFEGSRELSKLIKEKVAQFREAGLERIAILCRTQKEAERLEKAVHRAGLESGVIRGERDSLDENLTIIPVYYAKGLEYDGVILGEFKDSQWDIWTKYILCTRALHRLVHLKENGNHGAVGYLQ